MSHCSPAVAGFIDRRGFHANGTLSDTELSPESYDSGQAESINSSLADSSTYEGWKVGILGRRIGAPKDVLKLPFGSLPSTPSVPNVTLAGRCSISLLATDRDPER